MYNNIATRVLTGECRLSYVNLVAPRANNNDPNGTPKYSVTLLIPKTDTAVYQDILNSSEAAAADAGADAPVGGDVNMPDEDVPLDGGENLRDLDDEDVPLADLRADQQWRMGYLPAYAGIGLAALIILTGAAVYLKKKHKNAASGK